MANKETTLYVRNRRPNRVVFSYNGIRYVLERRGSREDTTSLPAEARTDTTVSRWLSNGVLEAISRDSFMKLAARSVDVEPTPYLRRPVRNNRKGELEMIAAESDTTRSLTQISDKAVQKVASPTVDWAGELMSTEEEIESGLIEEATSNSGDYPSRHRGENLKYNMR